MFKKRRNRRILQLVINGYLDRHHAYLFCHIRKRKFYLVSTLTNRINYVLDENGLLIECVDFYSKEHPYCRCSIDNLPGLDERNMFREPFMNLYDELGRYIRNNKGMY